MVKLVGILNVTPDSFSDGGLYFDPQAAIDRAEAIFREGAHLLDVGAESTRPGAVPLSPDEEWSRLEPVLSALLPRYPNRITLDTYHPETVHRAFLIGDVIVNDVTGLTNPAMQDVVLEQTATVIVSHLPAGTSIQAAHDNPPVTSVSQVTRELLHTATLLESRGLPRTKIILDPGIGFGKTMEVNQQLLRFAAEVPDYQVMIGYSRKRFLGEHRMETAPNIAAGRIAIASGAAYLRVHDVSAHVDAYGSM